MSNDVQVKRYSAELETRVYRGNVGDWVWEVWRTTEGQTEPLVKGTAWTDMRATGHAWSEAGYIEQRERTVQPADEAARGAHEPHPEALAAQIVHAQMVLQDALGYEENDYNVSLTDLALDIEALRAKLASAEAALAGAQRERDAAASEAYDKGWKGATLSMLSIFERALENPAGDKLTHIETLIQHFRIDYPKRGIPANESAAEFPALQASEKGE